ncbi:MAG: hypothetical protein LCH79_16310 [Proteobacteria bacterium]|nr:hypothetical protein [Pseudomonadota bacterium]
MADHDHDEAQMERARWRGMRNPFLRSMADVDHWAQANGGEPAVRRALADGLFSACSVIVKSWIELEERKRVVALDVAALEASQQSARSAERAARYAMWSAVISAAVGVVAAGTFLYTFVIR